MPKIVPCAAYANFLVSQEPVYDEMILQDIRPIDAEWMGYFKTRPWDAYSGDSHTFDRIHSVFPDITRPWNAVEGGACIGRPCDPAENTIGWGWSREQYGMEAVSWATNLICFDSTMLLTHARQHFAQIIEKILRPATKIINSAFIMRKAIELAQTKICVSSGFPEITQFTWDPGGYVFLNTDCDPTGRLTTSILQNYAWDQYLVGGNTADENGFSPLHLKTDRDTLRYMTREDPVLTNAWRFQAFTGQNPEYYKYGFHGQVGDYLARALMFPWRFNKIGAGRYQVVLPYVNVQAGEGLKQDPNPDYKRAKYQLSLVCNPGAIEIQPFNPIALNPNMPFMVRDYGGRWQFVMDNLGADASGRAIDNRRRNKGQFIADFQYAAKAMHPEWLLAFFHMVDTPCETIIGICNPDPGYPAQSYNSEIAPCPCAAAFDVTAELNQLERFAISANTIRINGAAITHAAVNAATLAALVTALDGIWTTGSLDGDWAVEDAATNLISLSFTAAETAIEDLVVPFLLT